MRILKDILLVLLLVASAYLGNQVITKSLANQVNKNDLAEVDNIRYGLFSVNAWKEQLAVIITDEINSFKLTSKNKKELKAHLESQLNGLIDSIDKKIKEKNKQTTKGRIKQSLINAFVDKKAIKEGVPQYADSILAEMTKAPAERQLKKVVKGRIDKYFERTFEVQDLSRIERVLKRTDTPDAVAARTKLDQVISDNQLDINQNTWLLIALSTFAFFLVRFHQPTISGFQLGALLFFLAILLTCGVSIPMIDLEAKISEMTFVLLDHPIRFSNQVLYYQTKSILDVFWIMMTNRKPEMKFVGILMISFSIIFPLLKMASSVVYHYDYRKARQNRIIDFLVLKSGKWSMSDVLVVAIFMAYIGFNGILASQFEKFKAVDEDLVLMTTNGTSLQPGFYLFMSYTILALFLTGFLRKNNSPKV